MTAITLDAKIAALTITAPNSDAKMPDLTLNIRDMKNIPPELALTDYPCLFPQPDGNYWRDNSTTPGVFDSMNGREFDQFNLNYYLALAPVGSVRGPWELYADALNLGIALKEAIRCIDDQMTKISGVAISGVKVLQDAAGGRFYGCTVAISAQEYIPGTG